MTYHPQYDIPASLGPNTSQRSTCQLQQLWDQNALKLREGQGEPTLRSYQTHAIPLRHIPANRRLLRNCLHAIPKACAYDAPFRVSIGRSAPLPDWHKHPRWRTSEVGPAGRKRVRTRWTRRAGVAAGNGNEKGRVRAHTLGAKVRLGSTEIEL